MPRRNLYALAAVAAVSLLCWQATQGAKPKDEMMELYGTFVDAVEQVESSYVRPVNRRELLESALRGMLQDLDPHSQYINERQWRDFKKKIEGRYAGIGITVEPDSDTNGLRVIAPMVGTPAYQAGVLPGDLIVEIDGKSAEGFTPDKAVEVLTGRPGTAVKITVRHEATGKLESLSMTRAEITTPSVLGDSRKADDSWDFMIDRDRKIGYVRITDFLQNTTEELKRALADLKAEGMKALIVDLRDNPGGLLTTAVEISDLFVDEGLIVSTKGRNIRTKEFPAHKDGVSNDFPMAVLVNQNSASASEILSACLQDHHRAKVVGQRSYGKGSVQDIFELEGANSVLKLTVASYHRPSGKNIHRDKHAKDSDEWGVSPDKGLEVKLTPEQYLSFHNGRVRRDLESLRGGRKPAADGDKGKDEKARDEKVKDEKDGDKKEGDKKDGEKKEGDKKDGEKKEGDKKDGEKAKAKWERKPFVDVQLEKALSVVKDELSSATARK